MVVQAELHRKQIKKFLRDVERFNSLITQEKRKKFFEELEGPLSEFIEEYIKKCGIENALLTLSVRFTPEFLIMRVYKRHYGVDILFKEFYYRLK